MIIWRIHDGKPGHDHQSQGLVNALSNHTAVDCHNLRPVSTVTGIINYFQKKFPSGKSFPKPDLIIGAGHGTHLSVLCAQRIYGGKTVIIMQPSLPTAMFDFCLIPEHDKPGIADNIIVTRGAINMMVPSTQQSDDRGIIMIGGPSKHFGWNTSDLLKQIENIANKSINVSWQITDSPRTPDITHKSLQELNIKNVVFHSCKNTPEDWLPRQLVNSKYSWVTADSMSMIYESLTAGAATGILDVPEKNPNKISHDISTLKQDGMITFYNDWRTGQQLSPPPVVINEAGRCAKELISKLS